MRLWLSSTLALFFFALCCHGEGVDYVLPGQKPSYDLVIQTEITIDRPVADVWHFYVNATWPATHSFELVSGEPGKEGAVFLVTPLRDDLISKPLLNKSYLSEILKIEPQKTIVEKLCPAEGDKLEIVGFTELNLNNSQGKTRLNYNVYAEYRMPGFNEKQMLNAGEQLYEIFREIIKDNNRFLKNNVERLN